MWIHEIWSRDKFTLWLYDVRRVPSSRSQRILQTKMDTYYEMVRNDRATFADTQTRWSGTVPGNHHMHLKCSQDSHRRACLSALDHRAFAARSVQALREATISPPEPGRMCTSMRSLLPGIFYTKWWMHPRNVVGLTLKFGIAMLIRTQMLWSKSWNGVPQINKLQDIILNFETQNPWWVINSKGCTEALPLLGSGPTLELLVRHNKLLVRAAIPPKRVDLIVYYCLHDAPCYP